jgi:hypothetical protein
MAAGYKRRFVPNFSSLERPLRELTLKESNFILRLNSFGFECIYKPEKGNVVCDALSKYPQLTTKYDLKNEIEPLMLWRRETLTEFAETVITSNPWPSTSLLQTARLGKRVARAENILQQQN